MRRLRLKLYNLDKFVKCVRIRAVFFNLDFSDLQQFLGTLSLEAVVVHIPNLAYRLIYVFGCTKS